MSADYSGLTRNNWTGTWSPTGAFPIVLDTEIRGGLQSISGVSGDRLTDITGQRLVEGMLVYLKAGYTVGDVTRASNSYFTYKLLFVGGILQTRDANTGEVPNAEANWTASEIGSAGTVNGNTITTGTGTLTLSSYTLTVAGTASVSGTNTGDNATNTQYSGLVTNATHTGDVNGSGLLTLATVNSNIGTFGSATQSLAATVNGKGLVTAVSAQTITPAVGSITGLGTNVSTFLATPTLANLNAAVSDADVASAASVALKINSDITGVSGGTQITNLIQITQAGYSAITSPSTSTVYIIVG